jgi:hypothetical protein
MAIQTQVVGGTLNATTGILTDAAPPTNLLGMGYEDATGALELAGQAAVTAADSGGGVAYITQSKTLAGLQALQTSQPPAAGVVLNVLYTSEDGAWNGGNGDNMVSVHGVAGPTGTTFAPFGAGLVSGVLQLVSVDVAAGTYVPFAGGGPAVGTPRDIYDVPTAKRKEVVDANVPAYPEADTAYYGCEFVDEVYGPGQPAYYKCMPSAPATTGGATAWKWFRLDIL